MSSIEELTEGSDRVTVLRDGRTVAELPKDAISQDAIMTAMAVGADGTDRSTGDAPVTGG